jgi:hypothetical protein
MEAGCIPVEITCTKFRKNLDTYSSQSSNFSDDSFGQEKGAPRCIFPTYWKLAGGDLPCRARLLRPHSPCAVIDPLHSPGSNKFLYCDDDHMEEDHSSYDRSMRNDEGTSKKENYGLIPWPFESRPSGCWRGSLPSLFQNPVSWFDQSPVLSSIQQPLCLR